MGYLTTVTFRNDCAGQIKRDSKRLIDNLNLATLGHFTHDADSDEFPMGNCANAVIVQKPRHADDITMYVHAGNYVMSVQEAQHSDWYRDVFIREMEYWLKKLKEKRDGETN